MRKADLLRLPIAEPHPLPSAGKAVTYVACFRLHDLNGERVLSMDAFDATCQTLVHRSFIWERDFISCTCEPPQQAWKWRSAMLMPLLFDACWWDDKKGPVWDADSDAAVKAFVPESMYDGERLFGSVRSWQEKIRDDQLYKQHQRELRPTREAMEKVRPLPDLEDWIQNDLLLDERYLFYKYTGKKEETAFCSHCGAFVKVKGIRHGKITECPACGTKAQGMTSGKTTKYSFIHTHFFSVLQKYDKDAIISRKFEVRRKFTPVFDGEYPSLQTETIWGEVIRDILRKGEKKVSSDCYEWGTYKKNPRNGQGWIPYKDHNYMDNRIFPGNIQEELAGTWAQYSGLAAFAIGGRNDIREDWYLEYWLKHPEIEMISKGGLYRFAAELIRASLTYYSPYRNFSVSVSTLKRYQAVLRQYNGGVKAVDLFQTLDNSGKKADPKEVIRFSNRNRDVRGILGFLLLFSSLRKINDYLDANKSRDVHTLRDYWKMQEFVGANMTENKTLFPVHLNKAHDEAVKLYNARKDKLEAQHMERVAKRLEKEFAFAFGGLMVVIPHSMEDLANEGKALSHCVRTYGERMARGETAILFIRKAEEPQSPYFTMEVKDGKVIQLRGKGNCSPKPDVAAFEKKFCEHCHLAPRSA